MIILNFFIYLITSRQSSNCWTYIKTGLSKFNVQRLLTALYYQLDNGDADKAPQLEAPVAKKNKKKKKKKKPAGEQQEEGT